MTSRWRPGLRTGLLSAMTMPSSGVTSPEMISSKVDLPQPLGPTRQTNSPSPMVSETLSSACTVCRVVRNHFDTFSTMSFAGGGPINSSWSDIRTNLINRERVRCQRFVAAEGARRENILHGSLTDEQRRRSGKDRQPSGLSCGGRLAALLLSRRALGYASSSRLASRPPELSASLPAYETGS